MRFSDRLGTHGDSSAVKTEITTTEGASVEQRVRRGLQMEDDGESANVVARSIGMSAGTYRKARYIVWVADREDLSATEHRLSVEALLAINQGMGIAAQHEKVLPIIERIWGNPKTRRGSHPARVEELRKDRFDRAMGALTEICRLTENFKVPALGQEQAADIINDLKTAEKNIKALRGLIEEMCKEFEGKTSRDAEDADLPPAIIDGDR